MIAVGAAHPRRTRESLPSDRVGFTGLGERVAMVEMSLRRVGPEPDEGLLVVERSGAIEGDGAGVGRLM